MCSEVYWGESVNLQGRTVKEWGCRAGGGYFHISRRGRPR
jgi:hypothetical protein